MSFPPVYNPAVANPNDGELITLCKILDSSAAGGFLGRGYDTIESDDLKGQPTYIIFKQGGNQVARLNFTWTAGKLTKIQVA